MNENSLGNTAKVEPPEGYTAFEILDSILEAIDEINSGIEVLTDKLEPILSPEEPTCLPTAKDGFPPITKLRTVAEDRLRCLIQTKRRINNLCHRIKI